MKCQIPEPLNIRPCQKPQQLKPRELLFYPVKLKKLPQWVDNARFEIKTKKYQQKVQSPKKLHKQISLIDNNEIFSSLIQKYQKSGKFKQVYSRGQDKYKFDSSFTNEFIPNHYVQLDEFDEQKKICKNNRSSESFFKKSFTQSARTDQIRQVQKQLIFDSKFQCGNLSKVYRESNLNDQFHLLMQNDINTLGYTQWFAFSVQSQNSQIKNIKLRIVNFIKSNILYRNGMKPWIIREGFSSWTQVQNKCTYKKSNVKNSEGDFYHQLVFSLQISPGLNFISMMPIYSYSRLSMTIQKWLSIKGMRLYHKKIYTLINNILPILEYIPSYQEINEQQIRWYDTIIVFARTHPGEVWSSFLMEQFIETTVHFHKSNNSKFRYIFLPMINPDGVIYGNFRCDFSGMDLNRVWINPSKSTQPSIYQIKKFINKQFSQKRPKYFVDFHSHSKSYNIFAYTSAETLIEGRLVSDLIRLSNQNKIFDPIEQSYDLNRDFLALSQTTFLSNKEIVYTSKRSTARAFFSQITQKNNSMTIQISFHGYKVLNSQQKLIRPFSLRDFNDFSWSLIKKLHDYIHSTQQVSISRKMLQTIYNMNIILAESNINQNSISKQSKINNIFAKNEDQNTDSDSQPQKYYTAQTKKKIKIKNGQTTGIKSVLNIDLTSKGYLKQTQSMIKKVQQIQKDKSIDKLIKAQNKFKTSELKLENNQPQNKIGQNSRKKELLAQIMSKCLSPSNLLQKKLIKNHSSKNEKQDEKDQSIQKTKNNSSLRRNIIIQTRKKQFKFIKERKLQSQQKIRGYQKQKTESVNLLSQQAITLVEIEQPKIHVPTFGKFLTTSKRNASRRYKTMLKQDLSAYEYEITKKILGNQSQKGQINGKNKNIANFLQDQMIMSRFQLKKIDRKEQKKNGVFREQNSMLRKMNIKKTQQNQDFEDNQKLFEAKKQLINLSKRQKKYSYGNSKVNNYQSKYISQRKRIVDMMQKQTRIFHNKEGLKDGKGYQQIQQIVQKRKRAKTQFSMDKHTFQDRKIFMDNKLLSVKKK